MYKRCFQGSQVNTYQCLRHHTQCYFNRLNRTIMYEHLGSFFDSKSARFELKMWNDDQYEMILVPRVCCYHKSSASLDHLKVWQKQLASPAFPCH